MTEKERKPYVPEDGKTLLITNIMIECDDMVGEIHTGGILDIWDVSKLPAFKKLAEEHLDQKIRVELYTYALLGTEDGERNARKHELTKIIDDDFPNSPLYPNLVCTPNKSGQVHSIVISHPNPQLEHQKDIGETADIITSEDLAEQVVYSDNVPDCCSDEKQPENMLGANIMDEDIYHEEEECLTMKMVHFPL